MQALRFPSMQDDAVTGPDVEFEELMQRLKQRDAEAYRTLYERYGVAIRQVVRHRLHDRLRPEFDSLDFVQDVWASFVGLPSEQYTFDSADALGSYLSRVARNKVIDRFRMRFQTGRRDIRREEPLVTVLPHNWPRDAGPSPSQVAMADERLQGLTERLSDGQRLMLQRLREGHTQEEVAAMLGVAVRTVERVVRRLKDLTGV